MDARVLFTNGSRTLTLYWLRHTGRDVYHGSVGSHKFTYHESGQVHLRDEAGKFQEKRLHTPLPELKGSFHLGSVFFKNTPSLLDGETYARRRYRGSRADAVMTIDSRALPDHSYIWVSVGLLEPGKLSELDSIISLDQESLAGAIDRQLLLETSVQPWVWTRVVSIPKEIEDVFSDEVRLQFRELLLHLGFESFDGIIWQTGSVWKVDEKEAEAFLAQSSTPNLSDEPRNEE